MVVNKKFDTRYGSNWEILGESSEAKPTMANTDELIPDASMFLELDTGDVYYYKKSTDTWALMGGS